MHATAVLWTKILRTTYTCRHMQNSLCEAERKQKAKVKVYYAKLKFNMYCNSNHRCCNGTLKEIFNKNTWWIHTLILKLDGEHEARSKESM